MSTPFASHAQGHYHLHAHAISKLNGQSGLAAAAYRRAERFERNETHSITHAAAYRRAQQLGNNGQVFDYRNKIGVAWTGIRAPAGTPTTYLDPQTLWNTVERIEHRKNARLAKELIIALPHQVDLKTQIAMLDRFIAANLIPKGMMADIAIHRPPIEQGGDPRNWHAHVLIPDRPMTPDGFATKKDRSWNTKDTLNTWRKAWADTHNTMMEELGLPHRIDHRSLEAQRADAIQRGDTIAALELDRTPQIHVGKAAYGTHPRHTIYRERRDQNRQILETNKHLAFHNKDHIEAAIARADTAAYLEARRNAIQRATCEQEPASLADLQQNYGRPRNTSRLGRLKDAALAGDIPRKALPISRKHGHPWRAKGHRENAPSIFDVLSPMVKQTGPGHPVFTVTAKDILFAFYGMGIVGRAQLQRELENISREEQYLFAERLAKRTKKPLFDLPRPPPPKRPTPEADRLKHLQQGSAVTQRIFIQRLEQLRAFEQRRDRSRQRQQTLNQGRNLKRARRMSQPGQSPPDDAAGAY